MTIFFTNLPKAKENKQEADRKSKMKTKMLKDTFNETDRWVVGWEKVFVTQNTDSRTCTHDIEKLLRFNHEMANSTLKSGKVLSSHLTKAAVWVTNKHVKSDRHQKALKRWSPSRV